MNNTISKFRILKSKAEKMMCSLFSIILDNTKQNNSRGNYEKIC